MKIFQHILFCFIVGWVIGDVFGSTYAEKLYSAGLATFIAVIAQDVPWLIMRSIKEKLSKA